MKRLSGYFRSALYNIKRHKAYALFCIVGTALTFVFITIILQLTYTIVNATPPFINTERTITVQYFQDKNGNSIGVIRPNHIPNFLEQVKDLEACGLYNRQYTNVSINNQHRSSLVFFVNDDYWKVNRFNFKEGRPFTKEEDDTKKPVVIISDNVARAVFKGRSALGEKIEFQDNVYTVIGVISAYSTFNTNAIDIWVPHSFNLFIPDQSYTYVMELMFPKEIPVSRMKENVTNAVRFYYQNRGQEVDIQPEKLHSNYEEQLNQYGEGMLSYGIIGIILLLLLIPAVNIIALSVANINNRSLEIAIRRSMGASTSSSFTQVITESFILVIAGTLLGLLLTYPTVFIIENTIYANDMGGETKLITGLNYKVILGAIFPLSLLFTILSGGIPAYMISKGNIAKILKGGSK